MVSFLLFIFILGLLVFVHELGHFLAAKKLGVGVEEFGFGYPPRLRQTKIGETTYSINIIPFGGFVKMIGVDDFLSKDKRAFTNKPPWSQAAILFSSIGANFLLAVLVFSLVFRLGVLEPVRVTIEDVLVGSPAATAGFQKGDLVLAVNGVEIKDGGSLVSEVRQHLGETILLGIKRGETTLALEIVPRREYPADQGPLGIAIKTHFEKKSYPLWKAPIVGITESFKLTRVMIEGLRKMFADLILRRVVPKDIAGPVGIAQLTGEAVSFGSLAVLQLIGFLSLNLALVNLLPLPALDGGRLLFVLIEAVFGRRVYPRAQKQIHTLGFVFLIILMVLVTAQDFHRLLAGRTVWGFLRGALLRGN
jgi:regulator of sigma E protease